MSKKRMDKQEALSKQGIKHLHLVGTVWFVLCVGFVLANELRKAEVSWWVLLSLSGPSAVIMFVLVSLYLFALFRGGRPTPDQTEEHPLTTSEYYLLLYISAPLLGGFGGALHAALYKQTANDFLVSVTLATFGVTFIYWVILDPILASMETFKPQGRVHRQRRLEKQRAHRLEKQANRDALLEVLILKERENEAVWTETLTTYVPELCDLLDITQSEVRDAEMRAAEIAVEAWRLGGLACMQFLHKKALSAYQEKHPNHPVADYITHWWDGIGMWRSPNAV